MRSIGKVNKLVRQCLLFFLRSRNDLYSIVVAAVWTDTVRKFWFMTVGALAHCQCGHCLM